MWMCRSIGWLNGLMESQFGRLWGYWCCHFRPVWYWFPHHKFWNSNAIRHPKCSTGPHLCNDRTGALGVFSNLCKCIETNRSIWFRRPSSGLVICFAGEFSFNIELVSSTWITKKARDWLRSLFSKDNFNLCISGVIDRVQLGCVCLVGDEWARHWCEFRVLYLPAYRRLTRRRFS